MGAVYRATDTKLNRDVAIKVLPDSYAADPERLARFTREAQVLASLNHPHIAAIYGVEDGALIMELVEGPDLSGPLAEEQAMPIIQQLIDALEYAHEKGIVHRDLKPANIKITPDGKVKVLDFGLAKAMSPDAAASNPMSSPTLTIRQTMAGTILGTAAYMAPEQARGHHVDKRADIWSFGVVLDEIFTGRRLFAGETVSDTLAAVLKTDPDFDGVPPRFRRLLRACLERDPRRRMRDIGDARLLLEEGARNEAPTGGGAAPTAPWVAAALFGLAAATLAFVHFRPQAVPAAPVMRFGVAAPDQVHIGAWLSLSPDGRYLGFTANGSDSIARIWVRGLDTLEARALAGSEGVNTFFWSPDSRFVAFVAGGKLRKLDIAGGAPQALCNGPAAGLGGAWNAQGVILFGGTAGPIMRVSSGGGDPTPATSLAAGDTMHVYPVFLSDGRHFLYRSRTQNPNAGIFVGALDGKPATPTGQPVLRTAMDVSFGYTPPAPGGRLGQLLFLRDGILVAQGFDEQSLSVVGEPVHIAESIATNLSRASFTVSPAGMLAYRIGTDGTDVAYTWFDREGRAVGHAGEPGLMRTELALSPDGTRLAHTVGRPPSQIAVLDLARGIDAPFTFNREGGNTMAWSPDGKWIAYGSGSVIYVKDAANGSAERKLLQMPTVKYLDDWTRDGRFLLYSELSLTSGYSGLWALPDPLGAGEAKQVPLSEGRFSEIQAAASPDSRWLAFVSNESGSSEIYVRPFPPGDGRSGRVKVSAAGGVEPRWRPDGKELYYRSPDGKLMAADVGHSAATVFQPGVPHALFATQFADSAPAFSFHYDVSRDGKRFLIAVPTGRNIGTPVTVVLNWQSVLRK